MKTKILLTLFTLLSIPAHAEENSIISIQDSCGYCGRRNNYQDNCDIDPNGKVTIERSKTRDFISSSTTKTFQLNATDLAQIKTLIESSKNAEVVGKAKTYCGDASTFSISALTANNQDLTLELYSEGKEILDSADARKLSRLSAKICGMQKRRLLWKNVLSKKKQF